MRGVGGVPVDGGRGCGCGCPKVLSAAALRILHLFLLPALPYQRPTRPVLAARIRGGIPDSCMVLARWGYVWIEKVAMAQTSGVSGTALVGGEKRRKAKNVVETEVFASSLSLFIFSHSNKQVRVGRTK